MRHLLPFLLLLALPAASAHPWDEAPIEDVTFHLVTADPGHHIGSAWFGHSGLLAEHNGTTSYYAYRLDIVDSPYRALITAFGDVPFSLHERTWDSKIAEYTAQQRSLRTAELLLDPVEKATLVANIESELARSDPHVYRMIHDNCSTRLTELLAASMEDLPNELTAEAATTARDIGPAYTEHDPVQAILLYLFTGPRIDAPQTVGESLFLPLELEEHLLDNGHAETPVTVLAYSYPEAGPGHARLVAAAAAVGLLMAAPIVGMGLLQRRHDPTARQWLGGSMAVVALLALAPAAVLAVSWTGLLAPHMANNVNVLLLSPLLLAWIAVGPGWALGRGWAFRAGRWLALAQVVLTLLALALHTVGLQVMDVSLALFAPLHLAAGYAFTAGAIPSGSAQHHPADATLARRAG